MKTIKGLKRQKAVFLHNWDEKIDVIGGFEDIYMDAKEYRAKEAPYPNKEMWIEKKEQMRKAIEKYKSINILFASYGCECYEGDAFVLFEEGNQLYEVNGSHCSCFGLEGQWEPELTDLKALAHRLTEGTMGKDDYSGNEFNEELKSFLGV